MAENTRSRISPGEIQDRRALAASIKDSVKRNNLTYTWLISRLCDEGLMTDKFELSSVLAVTRFGPKTDEILDLSSRILAAYEERMAGVRVT